MATWATWMVLAVHIHYHPSVCSGGFVVLGWILCEKFYIDVFHKTRPLGLSHHLLMQLQILLSQCRSHFASTFVATSTVPAVLSSCNITSLLSVFCAFTEEGFQKPLDTLRVMPLKLRSVHIFNSVVHVYVDAFWQSLQFLAAVISHRYHTTSHRGGFYLLTLPGIQCR